ncbi:MAG: hypothetical protein KIS85_06250 [Anaerolineales bacterium]|nr:hypothetical protein [Anaerolineales bacterium]
MNLYRVRVPAPGKHPSNEWAKMQANPSAYYPAVAPYFEKPDGSKRAVKYSPEMLAWVRSLQVDEAAYREFLWIDGGVFNAQGNAEYIPAKRPANVRIYIPAHGPWPQPPVGQPVTSVGNLVRVLEIRGKWARIETVPLVGPWKITPATHPWLFNDPFSSIRVSDNKLGNAIDSRGIIVPLFAASAESWMPLSQLEKADTPLVSINWPKPAPAEPKETPKEEGAAAMSTILQGKGMYLWIIYRILGGKEGRPPSEEAVAEFARQAGLTHVLIKVAESGYLYNIHQGVDLVPELVAALKARGIQAWGWQYIYGYPEKEADAAIRRVKDLDLDGFVVNAEIEFKRTGMAPLAKEYMALLKQAKLGVPIGFSSFRFPSLHRELPWKEFLAGCDVNMPQVYWAGANNPAQQLQRSLAENRALASVEIVPTGAAYKEHGWRPTPQEVQQFLAACVDMGLRAANFWEWYNAFDPALGYGEVISNFTGLDPVPPRKDDEMEHGGPPQLTESTLPEWKKIYNEYRILPRR